MLNKEKFALKEIENALFKGKPTLLEYANSIYNTMLDYIANTIINKGLSFSQLELLKSDRDSFKLRGTMNGGSGEFGLDPRTYFMLKYVYDNDREAAYEDLENFEDFSVFKPISTATLSFNK